jgi:hypothetical protein
MKRRGACTPLRSGRHRPHRVRASRNAGRSQDRAAHRAAHRIRAHSARRTARRAHRIAAGRTGCLLGPHHDRHGAVPVVAARNPRAGRRALSAPAQRQPRVLARPARGRGHLDLGAGAVPADHRPALDHGVGRRLH